MATIWIDGEWHTRETAKVSVFDHGLLYGDGVFEGIRVYAGKVFKLQEHLDRIYECAHAILLAIPSSGGSSRKRCGAPAWPKRTSGRS